MESSINNPEVAQIDQEDQKKINEILKNIVTLRVKYKVDLAPGLEIKEIRRLLGAFLDLNVLETEEDLKKVIVLSRNLLLFENIKYDCTEAVDKVADNIKKSSQLTVVVDINELSGQLEVNEIRSLFKKLLGLSINFNGEEVISYFLDNIKSILKIKIQDKNSTLFKNLKSLKDIIIVNFKHLSDIDRINSTHENTYNKRMFDVITKLSTIVNKHSDALEKDQGDTLKRDIEHFNVLKDAILIIFFDSNKSFEEKLESVFYSSVFAYYLITHYYNFLSQNNREKVGFYQKAIDEVLEDKNVEENQNHELIVLYKFKYIKEMHENFMQELQQQLLDLKSLQLIERVQKYKTIFADIQSRLLSCEKYMVSCRNAMDDEKYGYFTSYYDDLMNLISYDVEKLDIGKCKEANKDLFQLLCSIIRGVEECVAFDGIYDVMQKYKSLLEKLQVIIEKNEKNLQNMIDVGSSGQNDERDIKNDNVSKTLEIPGFNNDRNRVW